MRRLLYEAVAAARWLVPVPAVGLIAAEVAAAAGELSCREDADRDRLLPPVSSEAGRRRLLLVGGGDAAATTPVPGAPITPAPAAWPANMDCGTAAGERRFGIAIAAPVPKPAGDAGRTPCSSGLVVNAPTPAGEMVRGLVGCGLADAVPSSPTLMNVRTPAAAAALRAVVTLRREASSSS